MLKLVCALSLSVLMFTGCGPDLPEMGTVTGTVTMNGKPIQGVEVVFSPAPVEGKVAKSSKGITDESGKFTLTYRAPDGTPAEGAAVGKHVVTLVDILHIESRETRVPYRFSHDLASVSKSPFEQTVAAGDQQFDFDLTEHAN